MKTIAFPILGGGIFRGCRPLPQVVAVNLRGILEGAYEGPLGLDSCFFLNEEMGVEPKIGGVSPQIIHFNRVWNHYKPIHFGGKIPLFLGKHPDWKMTPEKI